MTKKIVTLLMLCIIILGTFTLALSLQTVKASETNPRYISPGENRSINWGDINLIFDNVTTAGYLLPPTMTTQYPPPPTSPPPTPGIGSVAAASSSATSGFFRVVWDVKVTAKFSGNVRIGINYTGSAPTQLWQTDIVPGDVNHDGKVNLCDLCIISKAIGFSPGNHKWNPNCDLNGDNKIDVKDMCIAIQHFGQTSVWTEITAKVDSTTNTIWGVTDHFSLFGVH
jgi:hypothetical protein